MPDYDFDTDVVWYCPKKNLLFIKRYEVAGWVATFPKGIGKRKLEDPEKYDCVRVGDL